MRWLALFLFISSTPTFAAQNILGSGGDPYEVWHAKTCTLYKCVEGSGDGVLLWSWDLKEHASVTRADVVSVMNGLNAAYAAAPVSYAVNHAADGQLEELYRTNASLDYLGNVCRVIGTGCIAGSTALAGVTIGGSLTIGALCGLSMYDCLHKIDEIKIKVTMRIDQIKQACAKSDDDCMHEVTGNENGSPSTARPVEGPNPRPVPPVQPIIPIGGGGPAHPPEHHGESTIHETHE